MGDVLTLRCRSELRTHPGLVRTVNEDSTLARDEAGLWLVADGMGGHANGRWASQTLVASFAALTAAAVGEAALLAAFGDGNSAIFAEGKRAGAAMGTTGVLLHIAGDTALCAWVGDSRAYRWRAGTLARLTHDHSLVQEMVDRGSLAPEDAEDHPLGHVLSRAVGAGAEVDADVTRDAAQPGDRYLLCSDGLTKVVADSEIARILGEPPAAAADRLLALTLDRGAPDNVSLVLIEVAAA